MKIPEFELERFQSLYEHHVDYNMSESGVHPLKVSDILAKEDYETFLNQELIYAQTNGPELLRERIGLLYNGAKIENILVTNGTIEANFLATWGLIEKGDEVVYMLPNYVQIKGLAETWDVTLKGFHLREDNDWQPDLEELEAQISDKTKVIAICNPNNPTGKLLSDEARKGIIRLAESVGAWVLVDEIYRGTEHSGEMIDSFWGSYDKLICTCGLSKAYGLPGLRIGWMVAPTQFVEDAWGFKDYTSITAGTLSYDLATRALEPTTRSRIVGRNRELVLTNLKILQDWIAEQNGLFTLSPPDSGAMAFVKYHFDISSVELSDKLHNDKSVLVVPGAHFGLENFLRMGYGLETPNLKAALARITETLQDLKVL